MLNTSITTKRTLVGSQPTFTDNLFARMNAGEVTQEQALAEAVAKILNLELDAKQPGGTAADLLLDYSEDMAGAREDGFAEGLKEGSERSAQALQKAFGMIGILIVQNKVLEAALAESTKALAGLSSNINDAFTDGYGDGLRDGLVAGSKKADEGRFMDGYGEGYRDGIKDAGKRPL